MGFRGYISSRQFGAQRVPQHIQNLVIRDYCKRREINYLLSATELAMPETYIMLAQLREQVDEIDGVVFYSIEQLPTEDRDRSEFFSRMISTGRCCYFSVEDLCVHDSENLEKLEQVLRIKQVMPACLSTESLKSVETN
jgi:sporadic carbohydrate cluster protein (TIGR04323 family)